MQAADLMGIGGGLLAGALFLGGCCYAGRRPIEDCCQTCNDNDPCKPKWDTCREVNVFFTMWIYPIALLIIGFGLFIAGAVIDPDAYWTNCGSPNDGYSESGDGCGGGGKPRFGR